VFNWLVVLFVLSKTLWWCVPMLVASTLAGCEAGQVTPEDAANGDSGAEEIAGDAGADDGCAADPEGADDGGFFEESGPPDDGGGTGVQPPLGGSSGGNGGPIPLTCSPATAAGGTIQFRIQVPSSVNPAVPNRLMIVYSGTEGGDQMCQNVANLGPQVGLGDVIFAVLDGVQYYGDGQAGAAALDGLRAAYDIDNDRTFLFSESAGTSAGEQLGFHLRQSFFAAYWVNDLNQADGPGSTAMELGFAPWGNSGPGGDFADANAVVGAMRIAGYRIEEPAPYNGTGCDQHGSPDQFVAALRWFSGKSRQ
jgi:hypothetical protein